VSTTTDVPQTPGTRHHQDAPPSLAVRAPTAMDQVELRDLAHRLGEAVPAQPVVVAAVRGRVVAAQSVRTGVVVFDGAEAGPAVRAALREHAAA